MPATTVPASPGWKHQLEAARRGRAVFAGNPQAEANELRRRPRLQGLDRLRQALGWQVACLGHLDHHADDTPGPERNHEQTSDAHAAEPRGQRIVERPAEGAGGGQGLDLGDRHGPNLGAAADGGCRRASSGDRAGDPPAPMLPPWD